MSLFLISDAKSFSVVRGSEADAFPTFRAFALSQSTTSLNFSCRSRSMTNTNGVNESNTNVMNLHYQIWIG